jgi:hypothetical protein
MRSLKDKRRIVIALSALAVVFLCGFISLAFSGRSPSSATYSDNIAYTSRPSTTPMPTMASTMMAYAATQLPSGGVNNESDIAGYAQVSGGQIEQRELQPGERIVIRNATLSIAVEDTETRVNEIASMAAGLGGWVVSSSTSVSGGTAEHPNVYGNIAIRVPAESLDAALEALRAMAVIVNSEQITGQDVTQDYVDTTSQLRNLEAAEQQLQTIMLSAANVDEVLDVFNQLVQTRSQIEVARGRLQYFDQASAFSSITITLNPYTAPLTPAPEPVTVGWSPLVTVNRALESLVRTAQNGVDFLITWGIYGLPLALIVGLPAFLFMRQRKQHVTKRVTIIDADSSVSGGENS